MRAGHLHIGVRSSSAGLHRSLHEALAAHVDDEVRAPPNYSVRLAEQRDAFHFLYWGGTTVVRTLHAGRLLHALMTHLFAHEAPGSGVLRTRALVVERDTEVLLAPALLCSDLARLEPLLARRGFAVSDAPWADVDQASAELLVPTVDAKVDWEGLECLAPVPSRRRSERVVAPGRYPLRAWAVLEPGPVDRRMPRSEALLQVASLSSHWETPSEDAGLSGLASLVSRVPLCPISVETPSGTVAALENVFERGATLDVLPATPVATPSG